MNLCELVFCPKCAAIQQKRKNKENDVCDYCRTPLVDTGFSEEAKEFGNPIHYERMRHIYETIIEPMGQLDHTTKQFEYNYYSMYNYL